MKITVLLLLTTALLVSASVYSQVTLSEKNTPLPLVLKKIGQQTGYDFLFDAELIQQAGNVTVSVKNATIQEVLHLCLGGKALSYSIVEKTVIIKPAAEVPLQEPPFIEIKGKVVNENDEPVVSASIQVRGTQVGTSTDTNGFFRLQTVKTKPTLVISAVTIERMEIMVTGNTLLTIRVQTREAAIDEVQIIAYGTTTRRLNTGSISTIKGREIRDRPVNNVLQTLQGKLSGVIVRSPVGGIGSPTQVLVRGTNSITSGNNPLIIVDGVIVNDNPGGLLVSTTSNGGSNTYSLGNSPLNFINPNDIESIDVLKDADATAIYGSRGTNGVLLITTKKASLGKTKIGFNSYVGWKNSIGITKRMGTEAYLQMRRDALATGNMTANSVINPITPTSTNAPDLVIWNQKAYTDYPAFELNNTAPSYSADVNLSGGTSELNYVAAGSYYKIYDTYMFDPYQERITGRMKINNTALNDKLKLTLGFIFGTENQSFTTTNVGNIFGTTNINAPNFELYKQDGGLNFGAGQGYITGNYYNPLPNKNIESKSKTNNFLLSGDLSYSIMKDLVAKMQVSYHSQNNEYHQLYPSTAVNIQSIGIAPNPYGLHTTNQYRSFNLEPQLSYIHHIARATLSLLAGGTILNKNIEQTSVKVNNPGSDDLLYSYASGKPTDISSSYGEEKFRSFFTRLTADWSNTYIANFSFRRDGSSRFGPNNRYANFGSVGFGWIFSNEKIFSSSLPILSYGKLRVSYGTTGNNNIPNYQYLSLLQATSGNTGGYNGASGFSPSNYANPNIRWETTVKRDVGVELGFLKNRIFLAATWYRSVSSDLLLSLPLPSQTGFTSYIGNFPGEVENKGFELELTTHNFRPNNRVQWTTKLNITHNQNRLKAFPGIENTSYALQYQVGRALPSTSGVYAFMEMPYRFKGIDPSNGLPQFQDSNKDGMINGSDANSNASWIGSTTPTLWGGLTNTVNYKQFSLDVFLHFSNGIFSKWNFNNLQQNAIGSIFNPSADVEGNYWMKPGDVKKYPRLHTNVPGEAAYTDPITQQYKQSDALLYKGYYIRLKNVQLTYRLSERLLSKLKFESAIIYVSGENLAVYVPEKLYKDPETTLPTSAGLLRTIALGIRISF